MRAVSPERQSAPILVASDVVPKSICSKNIQAYGIGMEIKCDAIVYLFCAPSVPTGENASCKVALPNFLLNRYVRIQGLLQVQSVSVPDAIWQEARMMFLFVLQHVMKIIIKILAGCLKD